MSETNGKSTLRTLRLCANHSTLAGFPAKAQRRKVRQEAKLQISFRKNIPSPKNTRWIERVFQRRHLAQMIFAIEQMQIVALQFADPVFGRERAANRGGA